MTANNSAKYAFESKLASIEFVNICAFYLVISGLNVAVS